MALKKMAQMQDMVALSSRLAQAQLQDLKEITKVEQKRMMNRFAKQPTNRNHYCFLPFRRVVCRFSCILGTLTVSSCFENTPGTPHARANRYNC